MFVSTPEAPLPTRIPRTVTSSLLNVVVALTVAVSAISFPNIILPLTVKLFLMVVSPLVAPIVIEVAEPKALIAETLLLNTLNVVLAVVMDVTNSGLEANTSLPVPVSSEITPLNSSEVVAANKLNLFDT